MTGKADRVGGPRRSVRVGDFRGRLRSNQPSSLRKMRNRSDVYLSMPAASNRWQNNCWHCQSALAACSSSAGSLASCSMSSQ